MSHDMYKMVAEFHAAMGMPASPPGTLRQDIIEEEAEELEEALFNYQTSPTQSNLEHLVKEGCDSLYVVIGMFVELGIDPSAAFAEVHRSNMSKVGLDGKVAFRSDGKVLKGDSYSPPNFSFLSQRSTD